MRAALDWPWGIITLIISHLQKGRVYHIFQSCQPSKICISLFFYLIPDQHVVSISHACMNYMLNWQEAVKTPWRATEVGVDSVSNLEQLISHHVLFFGLTDFFHWISQIHCELTYSPLRCPCCGQTTEDLVSEGSCLIQSRMSSPWIGMSLQLLPKNKCNQH